MSWHTTSWVLDTTTDNSSHSGNAINALQTIFALREGSDGLENRRKMALERALESTRTAFYDTAPTPNNMDKGTSLIGTESPLCMRQFVLPRTSSHEALSQQTQRRAVAPYHTMMPNWGFNNFTPDNQSQVLKHHDFQRHNAVSDSSWPTRGESQHLCSDCLPVQSHHANPGRVRSKHTDRNAGTDAELKPSCISRNQVSFIPPKIPATGYLTIMNNYDPTNVLPFLHFLDTLNSPLDENGEAPEPDGHVGKDHGPQMNTWLLSLLPIRKPIIMFRSLARPLSDDRSLLARCVRYAQDARARQISWVVHPMHVALIMERTSWYEVGKDPDSKKRTA